eukprot:2602451-Alexandrium_andersonii.AAC.1
MMCVTGRCLFNSLSDEAYDDRVLAPKRASALAHVAILKHCAPRAPSCRMCNSLDSDVHELCVLAHP